MASAGLAWPHLDAIWISHFHLDHVGGLAPLLAGTKHVTEMKARTKPLRILGPAGSKRLIDCFSDANNYRLLEQPFPVEIVEVGPLEPFEIVAGVEATAMLTKGQVRAMPANDMPAQRGFVHQLFGLAA